jgi:class 3 adenylate cyclase
LELERLLVELDKSKAKADDLLSQMLHPAKSKQLLEGNHVAPQSFDLVTVFFLDIVGLTTICSLV